MCQYQAYFKYNLYAYIKYNLYVIIPSTVIDLIARTPDIIDILFLIKIFLFFDFFYLHVLDLRPQSQHLIALAAQLLLRTPVRRLLALRVCCIRHALGIIVFF